MLLLHKHRHRLDFFGFFVSVPFAVCHKPCGGHSEHVEEGPKWNFLALIQHILCGGNPTMLIRLSTDPPPWNLVAASRFSSAGTGKLVTANGKMEPELQWNVLHESTLICLDGRDEARTWIPSRITSPSHLSELELFTRTGRISLSKRYKAVTAAKVCSAKFWLGGALILLYPGDDCGCHIYRLSQ